MPSQHNQHIYVSIPRFLSRVLANAVKHFVVMQAPGVAKWRSMFFTWTYLLVSSLSFFCTVTCDTSCAILSDTGVVFAVSTTPPHVCGTNLAWATDYQGC